MYRSWVLYALCAIIGVLPRSAEPYRPYPVIFVHGLNGAAWHWGVGMTRQEIREGRDFLFVPSTRVTEGHMMAYMYPLFEPYRVGSYNRLAAISLDDPGGSIDPGPYKSSAVVDSIHLIWQDGSIVDTDTVRIPLRDKGAGYELRHFIYKVLRTYYGLDWQINPHAKVVLVAHSMGGVVVAEALRQDPSLKQHIHKVISLVFFYGVAVQRVVFFSVRVVYNKTA